MNTRMKAVTILVLLSFLYSNVVWAVDTHPYKLASRTNVRKINEEYLPLLTHLIEAIRNGRVKEDGLPDGLKGLYNLIPKDIDPDKLTPEEIALIERYIQNTGIGFLKNLLLQLLPGESAFIGKIIDENGEIITEYIIGEVKDNYLLLRDKRKPKAKPIARIRCERRDVKEEMIGKLNEILSEIKIPTDSLEARYIEAIIEYSASNEVEFYILMEDVKNIYGFANERIFCLYGPFLTIPAAFFHEAGESFFLSNAYRGFLSDELGHELTESEWNSYKGKARVVIGGEEVLIPSHTYLRGLGKKARSRERELTDAEKLLPNSNGLEDLLFGEENIAVSKMINEQKEIAQLLKSMGGKEWVGKAIQELRGFKNFFPQDDNREIILFLRSIIQARSISKLLDVCLNQLLRPNTEDPNLDMNLLQCIDEIHRLLGGLIKYVPYVRIKRLLEGADRIIAMMRESEDIEDFRKNIHIMKSLVRFFRRIKKADIHHHLDGSISPYVALKVIWEYPKLRELFVRNIMGEKEGDPDVIFRDRIGGLDDPKAIERLKPFIEYSYKGKGEIDWDAFFEKFGLFYYILNTSLDAVSFVAREASLEDYYNDGVSLVEHKISIITPGLELDPSNVLEALVKGLIDAERITNGRLKVGLIPCIWKTPHFILDKRYKEVVEMAKNDERSLDEVKRDILKELPKEEYIEFEEMCKEVQRQVRRDTKEDFEKNVKQRIIILYEARKEALRQVQIVVDLKRRWEEENPEYASYIIGMDTVGDEKDYIRWVTAPALKLAAQNGFKITEHLGENWHPRELKYALLRIKQGIESGIIHRIGHATALGIDTNKLTGAYTDEEIQEIATLQEEIKRLIKQRSIHIETCPSSNLLMVPEKGLGLIARYKDHPVRKFYGELQDVSINTDDSWILHTVGLSGEFSKVWLAHPDFRFGDLLRIIDNGFKNSFLRGVIPEEVKDLSGYHSSSIINRVKDFGKYISVLDYQKIGNYPGDLITLEKPLTVSGVGWEKTQAGDYGTLVAPGGMPAINMMVDSAIERKGLGLNAEIIVIKPLYGCTENLFENLQRRGILVHSINVDEVEEKLSGLINERTAIIYGESVTNPNLRLLDIEAVLRINQGRAAVLIDDTFATPEMIRSLDYEVEVSGKKYSVDMAMLGLTKGMTGTGNIISGAVVAKKEWLDLLAKHRNCLPEHAEIIRAIRGLRYLEIRFKAQSRNAKGLINHIAKSNLVADTVYPGNGHMLYYVFRKLCNAIDNINLISKFRTLINGVSLGQLRNLFERPSGGTHFTVSEDARQKGGISPVGVRGSIGIENLEDVKREIDAILEILSLYNGEIPAQDIEDINKIFMAEYVTQEEDKRIVKYLLSKWPIANATFEKLISDLPDAEKDRLRERYSKDERFGKVADIIINATEITKYDPVTIAIHHRLLWCLLSGNHNSVIASPDESTTTHKQDDTDMQRTFASILEAKKKGFPPDGCFRLYSRLGRPGIATFELLMTLLEVGVENALNYDYIGTSFYSERMAHESFLKQQAEIVMMGEMMKRYNKSGEKLEGLRQREPVEYHRLQMGIRKGLDKEIIIVTQPGSPLFKEAMGLVQHDAVKFRVMISDKPSDIENAISDKTVLVYFDSLRFRGVNPIEIRDMVRAKNPDSVFGITDSFNLGYENPRAERDFDFITHVIYYEDSDYGTVIIAKNDKPLTQVWNNPYWSRKDRGVAMSEDIATMSMWYILPYLRVFDGRYEENISAVTEKMKGIADIKRIDKRHVEVIFTTKEEKERFLSSAKRSNLISVFDKSTDEYFYINEWTSIRPSGVDPDSVIIRIGIENKDDLAREFERVILILREELPGAIGKGSCLAEKDKVEVQDLNDGQRDLVKEAIARIEKAITEAGLSDIERKQALQVLQLLKGYFDRGDIKVFDAKVKDPEDYLLAFPRDRDHIIALARDFLSEDYIINFWHRLPEILFHEGFAIRFGERNYEEHRSIYQGIQRRIFGEDNLLKDDLRFYINLKLPGDYQIEFDNVTLTDTKLDLDRIRGLLLNKEFIYMTFKRLFGYDFMLPLLQINKMSVVHGGTGSQKQTLCVKFRDETTCSNIQFALKVAIDHAAVVGFAKAQLDEIDTLKKISGLAKTPKFGVYVEDTQNPFYAYSETWISGPTAGESFAEGNLTLERITNIVSAYLSVIRQLDTINPWTIHKKYLGVSDVHSRNVMFENYDSNNAVVVDIGKIVYFTPLKVLQEFDRYYGRVQGWTEEWRKMVHIAIFNGVLKVFGEEKGTAFLEEALNRTPISQRDGRKYKGYETEMLAGSLSEYLVKLYNRDFVSKIRQGLEDVSFILLERLSSGTEAVSVVEGFRQWLKDLYNSAKKDYESDMSPSNKLRLEVIESIMQRLSGESIDLFTLLDTQPTMELVERLFDISFILSYIPSKIPEIQKQIRTDHTYPPKDTLDALELNPEDVYLNIGGGPGINNIAALLRGVKRSVYLDVSELNLPFVVRLKKYYEYIRNNPGLRDELEKGRVNVIDFIREIMQMRGEGKETSLDGVLNSPTPPLDIYISDAADMPLVDNSVTKVSILGLFRWIDSQGGKGKVVRAMKEVLRVTRPGGLILHRADNPIENDLIKYFPKIAAIMGIGLRLKGVTPLGAQVFEVVAKSKVFDIDNGPHLVVNDTGVEVIARLVRAMRADNGAVDESDLRLVGRVAGEVDRSDVPEEEKQGLTAELATARLEHSARELKEARKKIGEQIKHCITLGSRILQGEGIKYVLIDKVCLPENQQYLLEGDQWVKRKQLLEKMFPGYRFNVFTGILGDGMNMGNTMVLTNKDMKIDARLLCIENAGEDEYFPIDGLIFLGIGLLNLSGNDTPLASTIQNLYKELTGNYMDIKAFLNNDYKLNIKLQPIARFDTNLELYAISLLNQAA